MASIVHRLGSKGLLPSPPSFLVDNIHYETMVGSIAYGVSNDVSDQDIYGWAIPPREYLFPSQYGHVALFDTDSVPVFKNYQQHRIKEPDSGRVYDVDIYNIANYLNLCMAGNPNMVDSMFTPPRCVLHMTKAAELVRERRNLFLHKGYAIKLKGYAHSQLSKMDVKKQNVPVVHELWEFEDQHGIDHGTSMKDIEEEMKRRGLS